MDNLVRVDKHLTFRILSQVAAGGIEVNFKEANSQKIYKAILSKNSARKHFYIDSKNVDFDAEATVTFKVIVDMKLYFLKAPLKKAAMQYYFDAFDNMYELVRRKRPRYLIPDHWAQTAHVQGTDNPKELKAPATILDLSRSGMRLNVKADLPRYSKGQTVNLYFKVYRRAEIMVKSRIIYLKSGVKGGGAIVGLEYIDTSILITNKIQNVCDDLAFHWTSES